jgi:predicted nucleic acid-binding protein
MRMLAHFDTNVFDHIYKREHGVTAETEQALRAALARGGLVVPHSTLAIEETVGALTHDRQLAFDEFKLILELTRWDRLLKTPDLLVPEEIRAFANRTVTPPIYIPVGRTIRANMEALRDGATDESALRDLHAEVEADTSRFRREMREAQDEIRPLAHRLPSPPPFDQYWRDLARHFAASFAERAGVIRGCRKRGFGELLHRRVVRAAVGAGVALAYLQTYKGRASRQGDSRDLLHVIVAAAAGGVFVTHDEHLVTLAKLVPLDGFRVLGLAELLTEVG